MSIPARKLCLALLCSIILAAPAMANSDKIATGEPIGNLTLHGTCTAIPDDGYDGTIGSMACTTVAGPDVIVTDVTVDLGINHTWVGDLTVKVVSPMGTISTMQSRAGSVDIADDGAGGVGTNADLIETSPVTYDDAAATSAEDMGLAGSIICQDFGPCDYFPFPDAGPGAGLSDFDTEPAIGDWMVCVGDGAGLDTGEVCSVALNISGAAPGPAVNTIDIPTVSTVGLLILFSILAGIGVWRLRRS